ncbi:hypothetical protein FDECE_14774 [Fusarium decemcellulare]|nr:hypothetical protein FDECE_14774 [Fusarium decemcellulare]
MNCAVPSTVPDRKSSPSSTILPRLTCQCQGLPRVASQKLVVQIAGCRDLVARRWACPKLGIAAPSPRSHTLAGTLEILAESPLSQTGLGKCQVPHRHLNLVLLQRLVILGSALVLQHPPKIDNHHSQLRSNQRNRVAWSHHPQATPAESRVLALALVPVAVADAHAPVMASTPG